MYIKIMSRRILKNFKLWLGIICWLGGFELTLYAGSIANTQLWITGYALTIIGLVVTGLVIKKADSKKNTRD